MNPRDNEREFGAMVRRGLASGPAAAQSEHLDAEVLAAYFERTLTAEEIRACDLHVSNCAHCRSELAALARAEPERAGSDSRRFSWIWDWRFLVPATAALTIFIAWATVWRPFGLRNGHVAAPIVAQNQAPAEAPQTLSPPPSSEMVEVSPAPAENAKKPRAAAPPQAKSTDSIGRLDGRPSAAGNRPGGATHAPETPPAARREFKKEKDRGASDTTGGNTGAGIGQATGGGYDKETQNARGAAASPPPAPAPSANNETVEVTSGQASQSAQAAQPGPAPSSSPSDSTANGATAKNVTAPKNAAAPRGGGGVRGAGVAGASGGIAAQKSAAPAAAETVTSRFKQDESTPIVIPTPDASVFWRVAGAHEIQLSRDIGVTWTPQLTETDVRLVTGSAPSSKICWVVGRRGTILRTVDGENWQLVKSPTELDLTSVTAEDADTATITASDGRVYATKNGGAHWKRVKKPH